MYFSFAPHLKWTFCLEYWGFSSMGKNQSAPVWSQLTDWRFLFDWACGELAHLNLHHKTRNNSKKLLVKIKKLKKIHDTKLKSNLIFFILSSVFFRNNKTEGRIQHFHLFSPACRHNKHLRSLNYQTGETFCWINSPLFKYTAARNKVPTPETCIHRLINSELLPT